MFHVFETIAFTLNDYLHDKVKNFMPPYYALALQPLRNYLTTCSYRQTELLQKFKDKYHLYRFEVYKSEDSKMQQKIERRDGSRSRIFYDSRYAFFHVYSPSQRKNQSENAGLHN